MGKPKPAELAEFEQMQSNMGFWENRFFGLWMYAQSWQKGGAGCIELSTLKIACEDKEIPYRQETRQLIAMIENVYRSCQNG